jgi:hypothetical protein
VVVLRVVENLHKKNIVFAGQIKLDPVESTFVILGYGAIVINVIFNSILLILFLSKRKSPIPVWIIGFNLLLLLIEVCYFLL